MMMFCLGYWSFFLAYVSIAKKTPWVLCYMTYLIFWSGSDGEWWPGHYAARPRACQHAVHALSRFHSVNVNHTRKPTNWSNSETQMHRKYRLFPFVTHILRVCNEYQREWRFQRGLSEFCHSPCSCQGRLTDMPDGTLFLYLVGEAAPSLLFKWREMLCARGPK